MTRILSFACHGVAVQVGDRLVSARLGSSLKPLDETATKLLIYRARDAMVSIGYAGQAYIGDIPTDEWIAQLLTGEELTYDAGRRRGIRLGPIKNNWDVGYAIRQIRDRLQPRITPGQTIQICVVGHQISKHQLVRPIVYGITLDGNSVTFESSPRRWPHRAYLCVIGIDLPEGEQRRALDHVRNSQPPLTHDQIASFLTEVIRTHQVEGVGHHTSAVILPFPGTAPVRSKFFPLRPHHVLLHTNGLQRPLVANHAPWVIGGGVIKPPTVEIGGFQYTLNGIDVVIEGAPNPGHGIRMIMDTVLRKPLPPHFRRS